MTNTSWIELAEPIEKRSQLPAVLTIAGSDSSGGAGIEADVKTITAHRAYALTCITALTAQNSMGVKDIVETSKEQLQSILQMNFADFVEGVNGDCPLKVVKTGMLTRNATLVLTDSLEYLAQNNVKLVVDPVMVSTSGTSLSGSGTMDSVIKEIIPKSYLCTPNYDEAIFLWNACKNDDYDTAKVVSTTEMFQDFVMDLQRKLNCENLLIKGGHIPFHSGKRCVDLSKCLKEKIVIVDVLYESRTDKITVFSSPYINSNNTHGTGCTLASSISASLANGLQLEKAVACAIHYVHRGICASDSKIGHGCGPLNHMVSSLPSYLGVLRGKPWVLGNDCGSFLEFFKNHESIKQCWKKFTTHPFLQLLANNNLPFDRFLYFLKQDYYYLINYARVHGLAASIAPNCEQIEAQTEIISAIMKEISRHREKLSTEYGMKYDNVDMDQELRPGPACVAYCDYLLKIGREQDFLAIKVALAPCLHGYAEAGLYGLNLRKNFEGGLGVLQTQNQSDVYESWLDDYNSDWYRAAHQNGIEVLNSLLSSADLTQQRMEELCGFFRDVVNLEIAFWDEVVDF